MSQVDWYYGIGPGRLAGVRTHTFSMISVEREFFLYQDMRTQVGKR